MNLWNELHNLVDANLNLFASDVTDLDVDLTMREAVLSPIEAGASRGVVSILSSLGFHDFRCCTLLRDFDLNGKQTWFEHSLSLNLRN